MTFRKRNEEPIEIVLRNKIIPSTGDVSRLNWEEHIKKLRAKSKRALNTIKVVKGKKMSRMLENPKKSCIVQYIGQR